MSYCIKQRKCYSICEWTVKIYPCHPKKYMGVISTLPGAILFYYTKKISMYIRCWNKGEDKQTHLTIKYKFLNQ